MTCRTPRCLSPYSLLRRTLEANGLALTKDHSRCHLLWANAFPMPPPSHSLVNAQATAVPLVLRAPPGLRVSQLPAAHTAAHKHTLARLLHAAPFVPRSFVLPDELPQLAAHVRDATPAPNPLVLICKPVGLGEGRGVFLVPVPLGSSEPLPAQLTHPPLPTNTPSRAKADAFTMVAQHYIAHPLLIGRRKVDLRVYVALSNWQPESFREGGHSFPHLLLYHEGLVRFAAEEYSAELGDLHRSAMHLCNNAVNRKVNSSINDENWTFMTLKRHLGADNWQRILDQLRNIAQTVLVSLLGKAKVVSEQYLDGKFDGNCFHLFGFDVLIDQDFRCWLLEVNSMPDISAASKKFAHTYETDYAVKSQLLADLLNIAFFAEPFPAIIPGDVLGLFESITPNLPHYKAAVAAATAEARKSEVLIVRPSMDNSDDLDVPDLDE